MRIEIGAYQVIKAAIEETGLTLALDEQDPSSVHVTDAAGEYMGTLSFALLRQLFSETVAKIRPRIENNVRASE